MSVVVEEFQPALALRGVIDRVVDYQERSAPMRRLEGPLVGAVLIVSLGPDFEVDGRRTSSFVAGVWDRPTLTGHYGEQAGYQLYLDVLGARRLLGVPTGELANRLVALDDLLGPFAAELTERLGEARCAQERHAVAQQMLTRRLSEEQVMVPEVAFALARSAGLARRGADRVVGLGGGLEPPTPR